MNANPLRPHSVRKERGLVEAVLEAFAQLEAERLAAASSPLNNDDAEPASHLARKKPL